MLRSALLSLLVSVTLAGCLGGGDDDEVVNCSFSGPASATVGGGSLSLGFVNLSDGADMTVVLGPQGLYMVTPSVRVENMYPGKAGRTGHSNDPEVLLELYMGSTWVGGSARERIGLRTSVEGAEALGVFTPFSEDLELNDYLGQSVTVHAEVSDACGRSAGDDLNIIAVQ